MPQCKKITDLTKNSLLYLTNVDVKRDVLGRAQAAVLRSMIETART